MTDISSFACDLSQQGQVSAWWSCLTLNNVPGWLLRCLGLPSTRRGASIHVRCHALIKWQIIKNTEIVHPLNKIDILKCAYVRTLSLTAMLTAGDQFGHEIHPTNLSSHQDVSFMKQGNSVSSFALLTRFSQAKRNNGPFFQFTHVRIWPVSRI